jgi:hypothetical protein
MGEYVAVWDGSRWTSIRGQKGEPGKALAIKGSKPTKADLPATGAEGDLWITTDTGNGWIWDADATPPEWHDIGRLQGPIGPKGDAGIQGPKGDAGPAATVRLGNVATGAPGSSVTITNSGATASSAVFNFTIPAGDKGDKGDTGPAPTMQIDGTSDIAAGNPAKVDLTDHGSGTYGLTFTIPAGATGPQGSSIVWKGEATTWPPASPAAGHAYVIGNPAPAGAPAAAGHMVVYDGATWTDGGKIQGPEGPTAVSADAGNVAVKGTDGLVFVPAGSTPIATAATLGGVIVGSGLAVDAAGKISTTVIVDATSTVKGIVKLASADDITNAVGTVAVTPAQLVAQMGTLAPKAGPTFTGQASFAGGTSGAPGITFTGDTNTGISNGGQADTVSIDAGGQSVAFFKQAGGVYTVNIGHFSTGQLLVRNTGTTVTSKAGDVTLTATDATKYVIIDGNAMPKDKGTSGQLLQTDGAGTLSWASLGIDDLTDVDTSTTAPTDGQTLLWKDPTNPGDSGQWVPGTPATTLDSLTDVDASAPAAGEVLTFHVADATVTGDKDRWISKAAVDPGDSLEFDNAGKLAAFFECNDGAHHALSACKELMQLFAGCHLNQPYGTDGKPFTGWVAVGKYLAPFLEADITTGNVKWRPSVGEIMGGQDLVDAINAIAATATVEDKAEKVGGPTDFPGGGAYAGGVLLPDGRVVFVPRDATQVAIFNPKTNATTVVGSSSDFPGSAAYIGGVLLPDGRVCFLPRNATQVAVFDPATNKTEMVGSASDLPGSGAFGAGVLLLDGRVCLTPCNSTQVAIFDPKTNSVAMVGGPSDYPGNSAYYGAVLLLDGRVAFTPYNATQLAVFDPATNTTAMVGGATDFPGLGAYVGGVLLPDGRACFTPRNATQVAAYDPAANSVSMLGGATDYPGSGAYDCAAILPNGKICFIPYSATQVAVFDPATNSTTMAGSPGDYPGSSAYYGGVLMPDGRVCLAPFNATQVATYGGGESFPMSILLGPHYNHF